MSTIIFRYLLIFLLLVGVAQALSLPPIPESPLPPADEPTLPTPTASESSSAAGGGGGFGGGGSNASLSAENETMGDNTSVQTTVQTSTQTTTTNPVQQGGENSSSFVQNASAPVSASSSFPYFALGAIVIVALGVFLWWRLRK